MKQRNTTYSIALTALVAALAVYITLYIVGMLKEPFHSVPAVRYMSEESFSATGFVIRDEEVLASQYDLVEPMHAAGEKIAEGEVIARIYPDEAAYERVRKIDDLESRLEQIRATFDSASSSGDAPSLETQISGALLSLSGTARKDNIHEYEEEAENLKSLLLRREYLYGGADSLDQTESRLESEIAALKRAGDSGYTDILSERAGTFSPFVDGYERILNTSILEGMTLEDFDELETFQAATPAGAYGKIISGIKWCFVAAVNKEDIEGLRVKNMVTVSFAGNFGRRIDMRIIYLVEGPDGRTLVTLQAKDSLQSVTALRRQTVEISFGAYEGIRIPKRALVISSDGTRGVYCVDGIAASFKKVTIISQTGDYYIVLEDREDPFALRVGNEVIVTLKGIYEGKILE